MPHIKIKGKLDPITVTGEIARKIKDRWVGNFEKGIAKASKDDKLDLGAWCGVYGQIKEIDTTMEPERQPEKPDTAAIEAKRENDQFRQLSAHEKSRNLDRFSITYQTKKAWQKPDVEVLTRAQAIQLKYFTENPEAITVPTGLFDEIFSQ